MNEESVLGRLLTNLNVMLHGLAANLRCAELRRISLL